jgi:N-methylhydantoinase B
MSSHDPITLEIIQSSLQAISDEMFVAMRKTAMSAIIYEVLDMGTGITDAEGNLASSGAGIPAFVGVLDKAVQRVLELHDADEINEGDIFATNDPHFGGVTHLNDMVLLMPVFRDRRLIAWTANIAHWNDVGGKVPGSMSTDASEVYQEGLRLPAVKLVDRGEPNRALMAVMKTNSRLPDFLEGDMWAGIAAVRIGAKRIGELVGKYGVETFLLALRHYMDYGEKVARQALKSLPKGSFSFEEEQDNGLVYRVRVEISDDEFIVDIRDNPDQDTGPNNACRDGSIIAAQMVFKSLTGADEITNGGTFRPLKVLTRRGSVFDAEEKAAFGFYYEVEVRLYDLIWRCLAPHVGGLLPAGHFASICGTVLGGVHPDTGSYYTIVEPQIGGWGAYEGADGNNAIFSGFHGETYNCPAEIAEARYGVTVERMTLSDEPGGEGRYRGGKGIKVDYRVRSDGSFLTVGYTRSKFAPWPLAGGREGSTNYVEVLRRDGRCERHSIVTALQVDAGDLIRVVTGNGAGHGDPAERDPEAVRNDIRNGYITPERAKAVYGVEV